MIFVDAGQASHSSMMLDMLEEDGIPIADEDLLETGDLYFMGRLGQNGQTKLNLKIGIELKYTDDLLTSLSDNRLMEQLPRMVTEYDVAYLTITGGSPRVNFDTGKLQQQRKARRWEDIHFSYHYLNSILLRFEAAGGHIRHLKDDDELAAFILSTYTFWRKDEHKAEVFLTDSKAKLDWNLVDNPLAQFYHKMGIGVERACLLAKSYPRVDVLIDTPPQELIVDLMKLHNFGKKTVQKIWDFLHVEHE